MKVNYRGTTIDGTEFDSSYKRGEPATFPVNRVITGWTEGLQLMKVGSKYQLFVPADLAYGERGAGADIGPNSHLPFRRRIARSRPARHYAHAEAGGLRLDPASRRYRELRLRQSQPNPRHRRRSCRIALVARRSWGAPRFAEVWL